MKARQWLTAAVAVNGRLWLKARALCACSWCEQGTVARKAQLLW